MGFEAFKQAVIDQFNASDRCDEGENANTLQAAGLDAANQHIISLEQALGLVKECTIRGVKANTCDSMDFEDTEWLMVLRMMLGESMAVYLQATDATLRQIEKDRLK